MATIIAHNILSPLGFTTEENYQAIKSGRGALCHYNSMEGVPFAFTASLFSEQQRQEIALEGYTLFESLAIRSIRAAVQQSPLAIDNKTLLIISSTKANVGLLTADANSNNILCPGVAAQRIAAAVGIQTQPIVVSNACISGVSALILGHRLLSQQTCNTCIVCGVDVQSPFIISGFQSFKALSEENCRPFDIERLGLNLGEAAATVILSNQTTSAGWNICSGAVRNDAYHISSPSPQGEGCAQAINTVMGGKPTGELALVSAHGTATMYNDQMESKAIEKAGLSDIPVNALKGYLGHTMGAAGVIETILTIKSLDDNTILGTKGFEELGVSGRIRLSSNNQHTNKTEFIKIISGFGGCNAAIRLAKGLPTTTATPTQTPTHTTHQLELSNEGVVIDGVAMPTDCQGKELLTVLYKTKVGSYPKFYKMDGLAKVGFLAAELLGQLEADDEKNLGRRAIVFFNKFGSLNADKTYLKTIADANNYFPSPSDFVYTLPNIVNGEIAIKQGCKGETCFYVLPEKDPATINSIINATFQDPEMESMMTGWIEYENDNRFLASIKIIKR